MPETIGHDARMLERLRAVLNFAGVGAWEWDLHTGETWWSDHLYAILGRPRDAAPTTLAAFLECLVDEDREPFRTVLHGVLKTGEPRAFATRVVRPDGALEACYGQLGAVPDEAGRRRLILGALRAASARDGNPLAPDDILLRALREQRAELLLLVEAAPTPLLLVDAKRRILHLNPATEEMFGWRAHHLLGRGLDVLFADPGEMLGVLLASALPQGMERPAWPVSIVSRGGQRSRVKMSATTTPATEGTRFVVTFVPCAPPPAAVPDPWGEPGGFA